MIGLRPESMHHIRMSVDPPSPQRNTPRNIHIESKSRDDMEWTSSRQQQTPDESSWAVEPARKKRKAKKSGVAPLFPKLLYSMLGNAERGGYSHIVSWQPHGQSFQIHDRQKFVETVLPKYFKQTQFASFQRQLNLYEFLRWEKKGPDHKSYYHKNFLRDKPQLLEQIIRTATKASPGETEMAATTCPDEAAPQLDASISGNLASVVDTTSAGTLSGYPIPNLVGQVPPSNSTPIHRVTAADSS